MYDRGAATETDTLKGSVFLIDGRVFTGLRAADDLDAVIAAGAQAGEDVAHLVLDVELEDEGRGWA